ncbi:PREDICTED: cytochrome P450 71A22-like [Camelina sativa]|uniref:Cytochrome P450 71A22-like n=1 Tax=Camelina sativa TaxID=90675 RepID=A0ABM1RS93_CAMSA|nr:PREDICTED: cytochrome P450 71A22-like [Camelina sativa]
MEKIHKSSSLRINLSELLVSLTNDVISRVALGRKYSSETDSKELMKRLVRLLGEFSVGTYVPWLAWIDWISGLDGQLKKTGNDLDEFLERVVQDHEYGDHRAGNDFVDVLLAIQREKSFGFEINRLSIKAIILDVVVGGTDTSYALMEWAMTELLRHPDCMNRLQEEVRTICKGKSSVPEEDIQDMKYLKAVIKETMRLHPPIPLMFPHESTEDVRLRDYSIPAGTQVMINVWAIGRDAASWGPDAEEFRPERHLDSSVDFRGQNFELIPFGAGRRICPAISFAVVLIEVVLANLVHQFDWRLPVEYTEDQTSVAESTGMAIHRLFPLYVTASSTT